MRSIRPGTCGAVASRSTTSRASVRAPRAVAAAASALATLKSPSSGSSTSARAESAGQAEGMPAASRLTLGGADVGAGVEPERDRGDALAAVHSRRPRPD